MHLRDCGFDIGCGGFDSRHHASQRGVHFGRRLTQQPRELVERLAAFGATQGDSPGILNTREKLLREHKVTGDLAAFGVVPHPGYLPERGRDSQGSGGRERSLQGDVWVVAGVDGAENLDDQRDRSLAVLVLQVADDRGVGLLALQDAGARELRNIRPGHGLSVHVHARRARCIRAENLRLVADQVDDGARECGVVGAVHEGRTVAVFGRRADVSASVDVRVNVADHHGDLVGRGAWVGGVADEGDGDEANAVVVFRGGELVAADEL